MNYEEQNYRGLRLVLAERNDYNKKKAKQYHMLSAKGYMTDITIWIPNYCQVDDYGTIDTSKDFMKLFNTSENVEKLYNAGYQFTY